MPSSPRARSSARGVLIAALSGRALAAAARRAGYRPLVADLFQDLDTRRHAARSVLIGGGLGAGLGEPAVTAALDRLAAAEAVPPAGFVYGAGFEDRPALLRRIAARTALLGNPPEVVARLKDPLAFAALLARLDVPHPQVSGTPPDTPRGWLAKRAAASGGAHVRPARRGEPLGAGGYFQRRVRGRPVSALFLADGARTLILGFSEQWSSPAGPRSPFRFGGLVQPAALADDLAARLGDVVRRVTAETGLVGLNSADFMARERDFDLLEVNPRPGASLDVFDLNREAPLFDLHCRACRGDLPAAWRSPARAAACAVVYARRRTLVPAGFRWPRWTADRPGPVTRIARGEPVCTVLARGGQPAEARRRVHARAERILMAMERARRPRSGAKPSKEAEAPCP